MSDIEELTAAHRERREKIATHLLAAQIAAQDPQRSHELVEYAVMLADILIDEVDHKPIPKREGVAT